MVEHANGISAIEGFVGDSADALTSIGTVFSNRGDIMGGSRFAEFDRVVFAFDPARLRKGTVFRYIVRKTSLPNGYAMYRSVLISGSLAIVGVPNTHARTRVRCAEPIRARRPWRRVCCSL